jgi:hypothetical protein
MHSKIVPDSNVPCVWFWVSQVYTILPFSSLHLGGSHIRFGRTPSTYQLVWKCKTITLDNLLKSTHSVWMALKKNDNYLSRRTLKKKSIYILCLFVLYCWKCHARRNWNLVLDNLFLLHSRNAIFESVEFKLY